MIVYVINIFALQLLVTNPLYIPGFDNVQHYTLELLNSVADLDPDP